jgi:hypothetical protein
MIKVKLKTQLVDAMMMDLIAILGIEDIMCRTKSRLPYTSGSCFEPNI